MTEKRFDFNVGDIACTAYLPVEVNGKIPLLVVCHGWGGSRRLWRLPEKVKNKVVKRGMGVVSLDFFGCGDTGGDFGEMTYEIWSQNLCDVLRYLKNTDFCDADKLGVFGFSSGSMAMLRCACGKSEPDFIISVATCATAYIGMADGGPFKALESDAGTTMFLGKQMPKTFFKDCIDNAPSDMLESIACPTLVLQGGADNEYRIADANLAHNKITNSKLIVYDDGTHSLDNCASAAANDILTWFYEQNILTVQ